MKRIDRSLCTGFPERFHLTSPVARVALGETFVVECETCCQSVVRSEADVDTAVYAERRETGPIYVEGVKKGDMIRVSIERIDVVGHASGARHDGKIDFLPIENGVIRCPGGFSLPVEPMIGVMYVTPDLASGDEISPDDVSDWGGNMDWRELWAGNALCFRARVDGALLGLGDLHAYQGWGEWVGVGAECAGDVTLRVTREETFVSDRPVLVKRDSFCCIACRSPFHAAAELAFEDAAGIILRARGGDCDETLRFAKLAGHVMNGPIISTPTVGAELPTSCLAPDA